MFYVFLLYFHYCLKLWLHEWNYTSEGLSPSSSILIPWIEMTFITTFKMQHYVSPDKSSINLTLD